MDEARAVMRRLERIEVLDREHADPLTLIAELRELVREAEDWARAEDDERADAAVEIYKEAMADDIVHA
jgi:hypothetical protein